MNETHLAIGNFGDDARGSSAGSAFIYQLDDPNYNTYRELFAGSGQNTQFGFNCALSDTHVVFTSAGNPSNSSYAQQAYAWSLNSNNSYTSAAEIRFNPSDYSAINGHTPRLSGGQGSIAIYDNKLFIGDTGYDAPDDPVTGYSNTNVGAVYMLDMDNPTADPVVFTDPSPRDNAGQIQTRQLGWTVQVKDNKVYAGAPSGGAYQTGLVYIWDIDNPSSPTKLEPTVSEGHAMEFGNRMSVTGSSLLVGAPMYSVGGTQTGAAYLFDLNDLSTQGHLITYSGSSNEDRMGMGVLAVS